MFINTRHNMSIPSSVNAAAIQQFLDAILDLDTLVQLTELVYQESFADHRAALIAALSQARVQFDARGFIPPLATMISSMQTFDQFQQGWDMNRTALHAAVMACPALADYHWMFLPDDCCMEFIDAANALSELITVVFDDEGLFVECSPQCIETLTDAYDHMTDDGHDMGGLEPSYRRCLACLASYNTFRADAVASHAGMVAAVRNQRVFAPFLEELQ